VGGSVTPDSSEVSATPFSYLANFGFETPNVGTYEYSPAGASWTFGAQSGANGAGISANASAFTSGNSNAPQGVQVAFIQGLGSISQALTGLVPGAAYQVTFSAAQRNNVYGQQLGETWQVQINGTAVGNFAPAESAQTYVDYTANFTAPVSGATTLAFVGTDTLGGDNTIFIDNVRIAAAPSLVRPNLEFQLAGGQIEIQWPADHTGWELQVQSNSLKSGATNWTTIPGSVYTNLCIFPAGQAASSMFFRLAYQ